VQLIDQVGSPQLQQDLGAVLKEVGHH
jgi:hypothetical protein